MLGRRQRAERDLEDELEFHLEQAKARYGSRGQAEARLGGKEPTKEDCRDEWRGAWLNSVARDLRLGSRILHKSPGYTLAAVLMLGLCIGANTVAFSVLDGTMLRRPPFPQPNRLVAISSVIDGSPAPGNPLWAGDLADFRAGATALQAVAGYRWGNYSLDRPGSGAETVSAMRVDADFFSVLGVAPARGRTFAADETQPGHNAVVVLSDELWHKQFGGEPMLGKTVLLDGEAATVIGIMPPKFSQGSFADAAVWVPLTLTAAELRHERTTAGTLSAVARLRRGATAAQASAEVAAIAQHEGTLHPEEKGMGAAVMTLQSYLTAANSNPLALLLFFGLTGALLLVGCANVAGLGLGRVAARSGEMAIRRALGASRPRLVRQILTEGALLALLGGGLGLLLSRLGIAWLYASHPGMAPGLDGWALGVTALAASAAALASGLPPALRLSALARQIRGPRGHRFLVASQVALTAASLIIMAAMIQEMHAHHNLPLGYQPDSVLAAGIDLRGPGFGDDAAQANFIRRFRGAAAALPGVERAALISPGPMAWNEAAVEVRGRADFNWHGLPMPKVFYATPDYFAALGIPLRGRDFTVNDAAGRARVAIVSDRLAQRLFPGGADALGQFVRLEGENEPWRQIVGISGDVASYLGDDRHNGGIYMPVAQSPQPGLGIVLSTRSQPDALIAPLRQLLTRMAPTVALDSPGSLRAQLRASQGGDFVFLEMLLGMGVAGLLLCGVGLYSVISFAAQQQRREIGIRLALGATAEQLQRRLLARGLGFNLAALAAGGGLGWLGLRLVASAAGGPLVPGTWERVGIPLLLLGMIGALAVYIPARRASRADPLEVLRAD